MTDALSPPRRAVAVIDGEHYVDVVRDALRAVPDIVVAAVLVGGSEKLRGAEDYGVPLVASVEEAIALYEPELVLDLSDEPVLGPEARLELAGRVLACGIPYEGVDFVLRPPRFQPCRVPALAVVGTGKRVGKTAVTGFLARTLSARHDVAVLAMGRGGPALPEVIRVRPTIDELLALSRAGRHAASDHLETALVAGVPTVGGRRCGGGLAGGVGPNNIGAALAVAERLEPELLVLDGSGAAFPPVAADRTVLVAGATQGAAVVGGYLNSYRARLADCVIVTMAEPGNDAAAVRDALGAHVREHVPIVLTVLRPHPLESIAGERVAFFGTAPAGAREVVARHLRDVHGADVAHVSGALSQRDQLRRELERIDADTFVVELKAAAVDVVFEEAITRGARLVVATNDVLPLPGEPALDAILHGLAVAAIEQAERALV